MRKKLISILLCIHMTAVLFSGCSSNKNAESATQEITATPTPEAEVPVAEVEEPTVDVSNMTPEEHFTYVLNRYRSQGQKGYTAYRGASWDTIDLDEKVQIDTINQIVYIEKNNSETKETEKYFLTNESGTDYLYIPDISNVNSYVKTTGHATLSYTQYTSPLAVPVSTAEYEVLDLTIRVYETYQNSDGLELQDLAAFYTKKLTTADGTVVEIDVTDIITVNAQTQNLVMQVIETEDNADETSAYNSVEEIHYTTGDAAAALDNYLPAHAYSLTSITYEEYMNQ